MSVRLRPHHLLCVLTFVGEGYSPDFVANLRRVVERLGAGEPIDLVTGPDDVCAPLAGGPDGHCAGTGAARRDRTALRALRAAGLAPTPEAPGFDAARLARLRAGFTAGTLRAACRGCAWSPLCTAVAGADYTAALLRANSRTSPP